MVSLKDLIPANPWLRSSFWKQIHHKEVLKGILFQLAELLMLFLSMWVMRRRRRKRRERWWSSGDSLRFLDDTHFAWWFHMSSQAAAAVSTMPGLRFYFFRLLTWIPVLGNWSLLHCSLSCLIWSWQQKKISRRRHNHQKKKKKKKKKKRIPLHRFQSLVFYGHCLWAMKRCLRHLPQVHSSLLFLTIQSRRHRRFLQTVDEHSTVV